MTDVLCDADMFASALDGIFADIAENCQDAAQYAAKEAGKYGVRRIKKSGVGPKGKYRKGFSYKTTSKKLESYVEIGNRHYAGLVHLLEKGHAKVGGGRVPPAGPEPGHIKNSADETFKVFESALIEAIGM